MHAHPQIRISGVTVHTIRLAVRAIHAHGIGTMGGEAGGSDSIILRLDTDAGITGWGEAAPWTVFTGSPEAAFAALDTHFRPLLIGADPFQITALMRQANQTLVHATEAKAAMEMALFDIAGQALGVPVHTLLGGRVRDEIPLSFSLANPDLDQDLALLPEWLAAGMRLFKVKTGFASHREDLRRLEKFRALLPSDAELRVDYNQGMQPWEAIRRLRDIETFAPSFIEQPVPADQPEAMAAITRALDTPIMADESVFSPADAIRAVNAGIADLISIKAQKSGGMIQARAIAAIAEAAGIACYGGDMFETGIACTAGAHMILATPNISLGCEFYQPNFYLVEDILADPFLVRNGKVQLSDRPGLGITVDEDKLKKYQTRR